MARFVICNTFADDKTTGVADDLEDGAGGGGGGAGTWRAKAREHTHTDEW